MNVEAAYDEMLAVFRDAWIGAGQSIASVAWPDLPFTIPTSGAWARVTLRHATGGQSSLAGASGAKLYTQTGTIFAQVFAPLGDGQKSSLWLAQDVVNGYRSAKGAVWYRNQRLKEIGASGAFDQTNVLVDFTYDD